MTEGVEFNVRMRLNLSELSFLSEEQIEAILKGISIVLIANPYEGAPVQEQKSDLEGLRNE